MEYLIQQLLRSYHRLHFDLQEIKQEIKATREKYQPPREQEKSRPPIVAEVHIQNPPKHQAEADKTDKDRIFDVFKTLLGGLGFVFAVIVAMATVMQWNETAETVEQARQANVNTREALITVQRAFVFVGEKPEAFYQKPGDPWEFRFNWENSGTTPTKNLTAHISYKQFHGGKMPDTYSFPDLYEKDLPHTPSATYISPKGSVQNVVNVPYADIVRFNQHRKTEPIYFYGWARYRDVFDKTDDHITRFCLQLEFIDESKPAPYAMPMNDCPHFNCWDDECKVQ